VFDAGRPSVFIRVYYADVPTHEAAQRIPDIRRTSGQTVTFPCTSKSTEFFDWYVHNGAARQVVSMGLVINSFKEDGRFQLRKAFAGDLSLIVYNITQSDSGVYVCWTENYTKSFNLTILREYPYDVSFYQETLEMSNAHRPKFIVVSKNVVVDNAS